MGIADNNNAFSTMHTLHIESPAIPTYAGAPALVPTHFTGKEGINQLFTYQITLKTADAMQEVLDMSANFDRLQFIGKPLTVKINLDNHLTDDHQSMREISGIITDVTLSHREARHYVYILTLAPWLYLSTLRRNSRIFQDKTIPEIIESILGHAANQYYPFDNKLTGTYPTIDYTTQFNETDFDFFSRLCEEWGINYFFAHQDGKHTLTLVDNMNTFQLNQHTSYQTIPFYEDNTDIDIGIEHIYHLALTHQATSGAYITNDYDYKNTQNNELYLHKSNPLIDALTEQRVYSWNEMSSYVQPHGDQGTEIGEILATVRMQMLHAESYKAAGKGKIRGLIPGTLFTLDNHPYNEANDKWVVTQTTLTIEETKETSVAQYSTDTDQVHCKFAVFPITQILRPQLKTKKPLSHGPQIAIVATDDYNEEISTDHLGRIKVSFLWDRYKKHITEDSCWIRMTSFSSGMNAGAMFLPRKGQEVIIDYIGGNIDRPICIGQVYNQTHPTPWPLPKNQAISGIKSTELNYTGRGNYLMMDDTENGIQTQLCSDHLNSKLSLGNIADLPNSVNQERQPRGEGFALETEGKGLVSANDGITITTSYKHPFLTYVSIATSFVRNLAQHFHPKILDKSYTSVNQVTGDLARLITYETAVKGASNTPVVDSGLDPSIDISSTSNINMQSTASTHVMSGSLLTLSSTDHTSMSVGQSLIASVKDFFTIFVKTKDFIVNTMKGKIILHAQEDNVEISAQKKVLIHSHKDTIEICADKHLQLHAKDNNIAILAEKENIILQAQKSINTVAKKDISLSASEKLVLSALKHLTIECKGDEIIISSPKKVIIKGGTSKSSWSDAGISHETTGKWIQKAPSHDISTVASVSAPETTNHSTYVIRSTPLISPSSQDMSIRYKILDKGNLASNVVDILGPVIYFGITNLTLPSVIKICKPLIGKYALNFSRAKQIKPFVVDTVKRTIKVNPVPAIAPSSEFDSSTKKE